MGRTKGSFNKNKEPVDLNFEEKTEVIMSAVNMDELEAVQQELDLARVELEKTKLEIETKKQELKASGSAPVKVEVVNTPAVNVKDAALSDKIAAQKARDNEMVTGKFVNVRAKGQTVKLPYHKYADDPVKWYTLNCGNTYTIPRGFADQINGGDDLNPCYYTPHFIKNENVILDPDQPGSGIASVDSSNKKYMFTREWK